MIRRWAAALLAGACAGCHGSGPLLHPAHVLHPGKVSVGAGLSGDMVVAGATVAPPGAAGDAAATEGAAQRKLSEIAVSPGIAPWAGARVGIEGGNEAGLTYTGRALRLDGRHAFPLGDAALSIGLGASALFAGAPGPLAEPSAEGGDVGDVYGAGVDVPILLGFRSDADLYALWFGPRLGLELLGGEVRLPPAGSASRGPLVDASGQHLRLGFVLGVRAGFRHVHVALEATATYHHATGEIGGTPVAIDQGTIAPGGGLTVTF
ncbi:MULTISPECIES: hypothetical protein [Sorangium]|uniref:Uncharacterized protein n=1 Tax=Sorangium cellulosum TaxID=56 RepID=A0A4P2R2V5_SORCE|nr:MULTISPECIES: hypothetical protein [Sorangium]AUX37265.1 hypothetical protein SOCE836_094870 [Sorangium cellulosum]WCQ96554.1 hypothetical protein NQZ70_09341 [Sorangium sp. Soce836]